MVSVAVLFSLLSFADASGPQVPFPSSPEAVADKLAEAVKRRDYRGFVALTTKRGIQCDDAWIGRSALLRDAKGECWLGARVFDGAKLEQCGNDIRRHSVRDVLLSKDAKVVIERERVPSALPRVLIRIGSEELDTEYVFYLGMDEGEFRVIGVDWCA